MASFRSLLRQVLHLQESPERTALAFAIGAAIAFCPFYGLHMMLVVFCTWAFGLNFIALMAGALINNPWTIVPILGATYWTGALILGRGDVPSFEWHDLSFTAIYEQVMPYAIPFFLGGILLSLAAAALSYPLALYFINKYRRPSTAPFPEPLPPRDPLS
jgi:uncharacterized protein (DUF2062 family)